MISPEYYNSDVDNSLFIDRMDEIRDCILNDLTKIERAALFQDLNEFIELSNQFNFKGDYE